MPPIPGVLIKSLVFLSAPRCSDERNSLGQAHCYLDSYSQGKLSHASRGGGAGWRDIQYEGYLDFLFPLERLFLSDPHDQGSLTGLASSAGD